MSLEQAILEAVRALPAEKQREVLNHAARLRDEAGKKSPFKSVRGLWVDLGISLSPEEIDENQREIWRNFPSLNFHGKAGANVRLPRIPNRGRFHH
jgi:hypothetical protein